MRAAPMPPSHLAEDSLSCARLRWRRDNEKRSRLGPLSQPGQVVFASLTLREHNPPHKIALLASIPDLLTLSRWSLVVSYHNGYQSELLSIMDDENSLTLSPKGSQLVEHIDNILGRAPLSALIRPSWLPEAQLASLALLSIPADKRHLMLGAVALRIGVCCGLGHLTGNGLCWTVGISFGGGLELHLTVPTQGHPLAKVSSVEAWPGFDGQRLRWEVRPRRNSDTASEPVGSTSWRNMPTLTGAESQVIASKQPATSFSHAANSGAEELIGRPAKMRTASRG